jgi:hypothetical protein
VKIAGSIRLRNQEMIEYFRTAPGISDIVFRSSAKMRRERFTIDIDLFVALAPPGISSVKQSDGIAGIKTFTF